MALKVKINIYSKQTKFDAINAEDLVGTISFVKDTRKLFVGTEEYCVIDSQVLENIIDHSAKLKTYIANTVIGSIEFEQITSSISTHLTNELTQVKTDLTKDINNSKTELNDNIDKVKKDLTENLNTVKSELNTAKTELNNKIDSTKTSLLSEIDTKLQSVFEYKGTKTTVNDLPKTGNKKGDTWNVTDTDHNYVWDGTKWDKLAGIDDNVYWKGDMPPKTKINTHLYHKRSTFNSKSASDVAGSVVFVDEENNKAIAVGKNIIYDQKVERDFVTKNLNDYKKEVDAYHTLKEEIIATALVDLKKSIVNITDSVSNLDNTLEWGGDYTWN